MQWAGAGGMRQPSGRQSQVENGVPAQPRLEDRPWDPAPQACRQCPFPPAALYSERNYPSDPFPPCVPLGLPVPVLQAPTAGAVSCKWCPPTALLVPAKQSNLCQVLCDADVIQSFWVVLWQVAQKLFGKR